MDGYEARVRYQMIHVTMSDLAERAQDMVFVNAENRVRKILEAELGSHFRCFMNYSDWVTATYTPNCKPLLFSSFFGR